MSRDTNDNWIPQEPFRPSSSSSSSALIAPSSVVTMLATSVVEQNSNDWEFMPHITRPTLNKNYTEIGHGDAMTAIIQDSTASSGEEQQLKSPVTSTRNSIAEEFQPYQVLPYNEKKSNPNKSATTTTASNTSSSTESTSDIGISVTPDIINGQTFTTPIKRDFSQTIFTETVTTGTSYRYVLNFLL